MSVGLDLSQTTSWAHHRSGWGYCIEGLRRLERPGGVLVVDFFEEHVRTGRPVTRPWLGFLHNVPQHPPLVAAVYGAEYDFPLSRVLASETWVRSEPHCLGIFVLSEYLQRYLQPLTEVPVGVLRHATEFVPHHYDHNRFLGNPDKKLLLVGHWLRDFQQIFDIQAPRYRKCLLRCDPAVSYERVLAATRPDASVTLLPHAPPERYDALLGENVVFLPLLDSSANNALLECIVRDTPVLVTRLPAVVEHLGEGYPLYYETLDEASRKVADFDLVGEASAYLRAMDKEPFSRERFTSSFENSPIFRRLRRSWWSGRTVGAPRSRRRVEDGR